MNGNNGKKGNYYSELSGWRRAVPIILAALATFVTVCFFTDETGAGALGAGIASVLLGLFSYGAYAIPLLLVVHAVFYAEDYSKKRTMSRILFSLVTVFFISTIEYSIVFWGKEYLFTPGKFYTEQYAGGFLGSILAYLLVNLLGSIGVIILATALFAIYIAFFFAGNDSAIGRILLTVLGAIAGFLAKIERLIKKIAVATKNAKKKKSIERSERINAELLDDQFFSSDGSMREVKVKSLGIHQSQRVDEGNAPLQSSVFHKSATNEPSEPLEQSASMEQKAHSVNEVPVRPFEPKHPGAPKRSVNLSFDIPMDEPIATEAPASEAFDQRPSTPKDNKAFYKIDAPADEVFTQSFSPFDFMAAEKLASKPSSKAPKKEPVAVEEIARPVSAKTSVAEDREREQRLREFEEKRKALKEMHERELMAAAEAENRTTAEAANENPATDLSTTTEATEPEVSYNVAEESDASNAVQENGYDYSFETAPSIEPATDNTATVTIEREAVKTVEFNISNEAKTVYPKSPVESASFSVTYEKQEISRNPEAESYSTQAYTSAPAAQYTEQSYSAPAAAEEPAAEPIINEYATATASSVESTEFKSFPSEIPVVTDAASEDNEETLTLERTALSPMPTTLERAMEARDERYTVIEPTLSELESTEEVASNDSEDLVWKVDDDSPIAAPTTTQIEDDSIILFGEDGGNDDTIDDDEEEEIIEAPEEEDFTSNEIPPEEQNPDVLRQRALFPILDEVSSEPSSVEIDEEAAEAQDIPDEAISEPVDDAEPPFEVDEPAVVAAPAPSSAVSLVPAEEPKKKEEKKKPDYSNYVFPPIDFLGKDEAVNTDAISVEIQENADKLIETLASFNVTASIKGVDRGPRITRYEVVPAKGIKVSNVMNLQDNIALELAANEIRMEAPIPGKSAIGIEIPNTISSTVRLRDLLETEEFQNSKSKTSVCIGRDVAGQPVLADIATMPHLLIAGATGMGKSVSINALMISMLYKARPDEVKFIMIDPKQVEFTMYNGIPHLLVPVVSDAKQAAGVLMWAVEEMERRYSLLNPLCVRNIDAYNDKVSKNSSLGEPLSRIVIVIDEFADLMLQVRDPVENLVMRIAQKARAAGIHLIIGTQRPTTNVITGTIKANIPSRISCKVASNVDSRTVLDTSGAEKLLNKGDMLYAFSGAIKPLRVQGAFVSDSEVESVMEHLKKFSDGNSYDDQVMADIERAAQKCSKKSGGDDDDGDDGSSGEGYLNDHQFLDAVEVAVNTGKISTSLIQRKLSIGYGKAAKFIDIMEDMGIVGEQNGQRPREVKISPDEWREKLARATLD